MTKYYDTMRKIEEAIWVSTDGNDGNPGTPGAPIATITKAMALATSTRNTILVEPGLYDESLVWPNVDELRLIGLASNGAVVIRGTTVADETIKIDPTWAPSDPLSFDAFLENIQIQHRTGKVGLQIDNANVTKKLMVYLRNVGTSQEGTGNSIDINHTTAGQAIRVYAEAQGEEIEGPINIVCANAADRFRFNGFMLSGGLVTDAGAVACEITLQNCGWESGGITGGHGSQKLNTINCFLFDGTDYSSADSLSTTHANVNLSAA